MKQESQPLNCDIWSACVRIRAFVSLICHDVILRLVYMGLGRVCCFKFFSQRLPSLLLNGWFHCCVQNIPSLVVLCQG